MMRLLTTVVLVSACASATPTWAPERCRRRDPDGLRRTICKEEIVETMQARAPELQTCVGTLSANANKPNAIREVDATFVIRADGSTGDYTLTPRALSGSSTAHCIIGVLESLQFPAFVHGALPVTFPIRVP